MRASNRIVGLIAFVSLLGLASLQGETIVSNADAFVEAIEGSRPGDVILVEDGVYRDLRIVIDTDRVSIKAIRPGKAIISGDAKIELNGDEILFSGFYFKDGARNPSEWASHGPGLVTVRGSRTRITECAFHEFDTADGGWITVTPTAAGVVPMYVRIDHCSFTNKPSFDQVVNLNNCDRLLWPETYKKVDGAKGAPPMYHRLDHCYFSNPPKKGNAGGGIRVGTWRNDVGRCLIDNNLFERQDSEAEIITSKSRENIYFNNTFLNCQGTLNFRHGDIQYAIGNWFLGTDRKFGYGGLFVWGSDHSIVGNYFDLPRTRETRGEACIYLNAGVYGTEHARADRNLIANNTFIVERGSIFHLNALLERRIPWAKEAYGVGDLDALLPRDNRMLGNVMVVGSEDYEAVRGEALSNQIWEHNYFSGNGILNTIDGVEKRPIDFRRGEDALKVPVVSNLENGGIPVRVEFDPELLVNPNELFNGRPVERESSPRISLDGLLESKGPLQFKDVGPSWLRVNPSSYSTGGEVGKRLKRMLQATHARRKDASAN